MKRYACIFISAEQISLCTAQRGAGAAVKILDRAKYPLSLEHEIHETGHVGSQSILDLRRLLSEYIRLARENAVEALDIFISAEVACASNFLYLLDALKISSDGVPIHVLSIENELERFCLSVRCSEETCPEDANAVMVSISGDQLYFAATENGLIDYSEEIEFGYLRLADMTESIADVSENTSRLLSEIIRNKLRIPARHLKKRRIDKLILMTRDEVPLAKIANHTQICGHTAISRKTLDELYHKIKNLTPNQVNYLYPHLPDGEGDTLLATVILCQQLMEAVDADVIQLMPTDRAVRQVEFMFRKTRYAKALAWIEESEYLCARKIAERYLGETAHLDATEFFALRFFETLRKRYGLSRRERRLLRLAVRLCDVGQFGGEAGQSRACEDIIIREKIIGLSSREQHMVARIARDARSGAYNADPPDPDFPPDDALTIARLTAIIKLAFAMDQSRLQKLGKLRCALREDQMIVSAEAAKNAHLESYYFMREAACIQQVYGVVPILKLARPKL